MGKFLQTFQMIRAKKVEIIKLRLDADTIISIFAYPSTILRKGEPLKAGERWITVHPHGDESKGQPVLIAPNPDGTYSIVGGAGAESMRHLRLRNVKSPEQYAKERKEKEAERRAKEKERQAGLTAEEKTGEKKAKLSAKAEKYRRERAYIEHVREKAGGVSKDLDEEELKARGFKDKDIAKFQRKNHEKQLKEAKKVESQIKRRLIIDQAARQKAEELGVRPEELREMILHDEPDTKTGERRGFDPQYKARAQAVILDELDRADPAELELDYEEARATATIEEHPAHQINEMAKERRLQAYRIKDIDPDEAVRLINSAERLETTFHRQLQKEPEKAAATVLLMTQPRKARKALSDALGLDQPEVTPLKDSELADFMSVVKSGKQLRQNIRELNQAEEEIKKSKNYGAGITIKHADIHDADMQAMVEREARDLEGITLARTLRGEITADHPDHYKFLANGHYQSLNNAMLAISGGTLLDRDVPDIIGVFQTAQILKWKWQEEGRNPAALASAIEKFHVEQAGKITQKAMADALPYLKEAQALDQGILETGFDLARAHEQTLARDEALSEVQRIYAGALGQLEGTAALIQGLKAPLADSITVDAKDTADTMNRLRVLGFTSDQMQVDHENGRVIIPQKHFASAFREIITPEEHANNQKIQEIKEGKHDEEEWVPQGFTKRSATLFSQNEMNATHDLLLNQIDHREYFEALTEESTPQEVKEAMERYIGAQILAGKSIEAIMIEMADNSFLTSMIPRSTGEDRLNQPRRVFRDHLDSLFPPSGFWSQADKDRLHAFADQMAKSEGGSFHAQGIDINHPAIHEITFQSLNTIPEGRFAFKETGQLSTQEQRQLRQYWYKHFGKPAAEKDQIAARAQARAIPPDKRGTRGYRFPQEEWVRYRRETGGGEDEAIQRAQKELAEIEKKAWKAQSDNPFAAMLGGGEERALPPHVAVDLNDLDSLIEHMGGRLVDKRNLRETLAKGPNDINNVMGMMGEDLSGEKRKNFKQELESNPELRRQVFEQWKQDRFDDLREAAIHQIKSDWENKIMDFTDAEKERRHDTPIDEKDLISPSWGEYVRSHGGLRHAQETILAHIRGKYGEAFQSNYQRITGKKLEARRENLPHWREHLHGSVSAYTSRRLRAAEEHAVQSAKGRVRKRTLHWDPKNKRFFSGFAKEEEGVSVRERAKGLLEAEERPQEKIAGIDEGVRRQFPIEYERTTFGRRAEAQMASLITPNMEAAFRENNPIKLIKNVSFSGRFAGVQRAIKMLEIQKRLYVARGVGSAKTATSIGAFTHLHNQGRVKRGLFIVPTQVQGQFGEEMRRFTEPGKYRWDSEPSRDFKGRLESYKNPNIHMVVVTHQAFRNDMIKLMAQDKEKPKSEVMQEFMEMPREKRIEAIKAIMERHGINFDFHAVDEMHMLSNRAGKKEASMAAVIDAATHPKNTKYFLGLSGTPVKNDISEAFDALQKIAPDKYNDFDAFKRRFGVDIQASREAMRREMAPHFYSGRVDLDVKVNNTDNPVIRDNEKQHRKAIPLTPEQQRAYDDVTNAFHTAQQYSFGVDADTRTFHNAINDPKTAADLIRHMPNLLTFGHKLKMSDDEINQLEAYNTPGTTDDDLVHVHPHVKELLQSLQRRFNFPLDKLRIDPAEYRPVHVESMKKLSPSSFEGKPSEEHEKIARSLARNIGTARDAAYSRVVNSYHGPDGDKLKAMIQDAGKRGVPHEVAKAKRAYAEHAMIHNAKLKGVVDVVLHDLSHGLWEHHETGETLTGRKGIIFAENRATINLLKHVLESRTFTDPHTGQTRAVRVGVITGDETGKKRDVIRNGFNSPSGRPEDAYFDILLLSSAGEAGLNLQTGKTIHHFDQPLTNKAHMQRTGRLVRLGQEGDVHVHNWLTDTEFERRRRKIVTKKSDLADVYQADADHLDSEGIAAYLGAALGKRNQEANLGVQGAA